MEVWRLITTWGARPAFNMGLDEALLESAGAPPTLRFYTWNPETLSLGYFQRCGDVPAIEHERSVVRRMTGGGAIHHAGELTFSISAPLDHPLYRGPIAESYRRVHGAIAAALAEYGVQADLRGERALASDRTGTGMCFHRSTPLDLVWDGRKGVGSAQRRRAGRVLHHGSIKIRPSPVEGEVARVDRQGAGVTPEGFAATLRSAFERELRIEIAAGVPDDFERARAARLGARYVDPTFIRRR
jgi:lipoate-protein ligase A